MNIEAKAKEYIKGIASAYKEDAEIDFTAGYTQAVTDLNAENEKLRVVLSSLVDKVNMLTYSIVEEEREVNDEFFAETMDSLAKAKQLITEP